MAILPFYRGQDKSNMGLKRTLKSASLSSFVSILPHHLAVRKWKKHRTKLDFISTRPKEDEKEQEDLKQKLPPDFSQFQVTNLFQENHDVRRESGWP
ncbi:hypothetical protein YC2023_068278 [Brassica napus]